MQLNSHTGYILYSLCLVPEEEEEEEQGGTESAETENISKT